MKNDIDLFPYMKYNNENIPFHFHLMSKNKLDNNNIKENKNCFFSLQNNDKIIRNKKYKFKIKRRRNQINNLSENISFKNIFKKRKYIKNMKYYFLDNNSNNYKCNSSNNRSKKIIKHNSISNLNYYLKSLINNKDNSDISYNQSNYSYDKKNKKRNQIIKRNKEKILNSSKSYCLFDKKLKMLDRPKSNQCKTESNKIIFNYLNKKNNLYNNKMAEIDKYLNIYFSDNNKKHQKSSNNININNIIAKTAKNYFTNNEINVKKSNKNKISPKNNIINKNYNSSRIKEVDKEVKIEKLYKAQKKGWKIKLNRNNTIENNNCKNIYTITPYIDENKKCINENTSNSKYNIHLLNKEISIKEKNKEEYKNQEQTFLNHINESKIRKKKNAKECIINYDNYKTRNKSNNSNNIYLNRTENFSHKIINENKKNINHFINASNQIKMNKEVYKNDFDEEGIVHRNQLYDSLNNKENYQINNNPINCNNYINEIQHYKNKQNYGSELNNKKYMENNLQKRNNSSYFLINNQKMNKEQNISLIRKYLHNYYEIKSKQNMKKNNSFKIRNHYEHKDIIFDNDLKNNLLNNLIKKDENNNNIFYNDLSSNVNININITPQHLSRENIKIKLEDNINKNQNFEGNESNSIHILTPSFMKTNKELNKEDKAFIKKNILNNFQKYNKNQNNNNNININNLGYDYTFKKMNYINKNCNDLNKENKNNNKYYNKINSEKRKDDLIHLLHFSENLGLNFNEQ